ncbi:MAG: hypothetical protein NTV86_10140 [Planctomycetota bacterium]|nr:hypothetical protein [Planctomycetota bacterium]
MKQKTQTGYDYHLLTRSPEVFGFFVGWFAQGLLMRAYVSDAMKNCTDPPAGWDLCRRDVWRLAAMVHAWCSTRALRLPLELPVLLTDLGRLCGPEGYQSSAEAVQGPRDPRDARSRSRRNHYWPNLTRDDHDLTGEMGQLQARIRGAATAVADLAAQQNAMSAGANLHRLAYDPRDGRYRTDEPFGWLECLVNLGLLAPTPDWDTGTPSLRGVQVMEQLKRQTGLEDECEASKKIPEIICENLQVQCPPLDTDRDLVQMPDLAGVTLLAEEPDQKESPVPSGSLEPPAAPEGVMLWIDEKDRAFFLGEEVSFSLDRRARHAIPIIKALWEGDGHELTSRDLATQLGNMGVATGHTANQQRDYLSRFRGSLQKQTRRQKVPQGQTKESIHEWIKKLGRSTGDPEEKSIVTFWLGVKMSEVAFAPTEEGQAQ